MQRFALTVNFLFLAVPLTGRIVEYFAYNDDKKGVLQSS